MRGISISLIWRSFYWDCLPDIFWVSAAPHFSTSLSVGLLRPLYRRWMCSNVELCCECLGLMLGRWSYRNTTSSSTDCITVSLIRITTNRALSNPSPHHNRICFPYDLSLSSETIITLHYFQECGCGWRQIMLFTICRRRQSFIHWWYRSDPWLTSPHPVPGCAGVLTPHSEVTRLSMRRLPSESWLSSSRHQLGPFSVQILSKVHRVLSYSGMAK